MLLIGAGLNNKHSLIGENDVLQLREGRSLVHLDHRLYNISGGIHEFNYRAWHFITSFKDYVLYVGQKARENQWRVMVLGEFLHLALLYQATNTRNINDVTVLKQYLVLVKKNNGMTFIIDNIDYV